MITEAMPSTMIETSWLTKAIPPMAMSQPKPSETTMSNRWRARRKAQTNKPTMSVAAMEMAQMLSVFICEALSTAITGAPVAAKCTPGMRASMLRATLSICLTSSALPLVSLAPYGEVSMATAWRSSGVKI